MDTFDSLFSELRCHCHANAGQVTSTAGSHVNTGLREVKTGQPRPHGAIGVNTGPTDINTGPSDVNILTAPAGIVSFLFDTFELMSE